MYTLGIIVILVSGIWFLIARSKKRLAANPKGWQVPAAILGGGGALLILGIVCSVAGAASRNKEAREAQRQTEADSVFAWTIAENPDTASLEDIRKAVGVLSKYNVTPSEELRTRGINLHLKKADSLTQVVLSLPNPTNLTGGQSMRADVKSAILFLGEIQIYGELNSSQQNKYNTFENRLKRKHETLDNYCKPEEERLERKRQLEEERLAQEAKREEEAPLQRELFAIALENSYLDNGLETTAVAIGHNSNVLCITGPWINKVQVHEIKKNSEFLTKLKGLGFKEILLANDDTGKKFHWDL